MSTFYSLFYIINTGFWIEITYDFCRFSKNSITVELKYVQGLNFNMFVNWWPGKKCVKIVVTNVFSFKIYGPKKNECQLKSKHLNWVRHSETPLSKSDITFKRINVISPNFDTFWGNIKAKNVLKLELHTSFRSKVIGKKNKYFTLIRTTL